MSISASHLPVLPVVVPLITAPLVMLLRERGLAWAATVAASVCTFAMAVHLVSLARAGESLTYDLGGWPAPYGIELVVDAFAALLLLIVTGASTAALLVARTSLEREIPAARQPLFYTAWLLALGGLIGIVVAGDAFNIFVFLEISSLASYVLIAGGPRREALPAVFKYLMMGTIGATFYLIGVGLIYMMTGTLNLADMAARLDGVSDLRPVLIAAGFITVGMALKAAVFPLHGWLPNAYRFAPHAATVFIAACSTKVALYVLVRFDFQVFRGNMPGNVEQFSSYVLPLAVIAILIASAIAVFERDLKKLLAYSSVAHVGYILLAVSLISATGLTAGVTHMFSHALAKGALFLAVACLAMRLSDLSVDGLAGAAHRMPITMAGFVVAGLSLIGVPGTVGFVSKWYLVLSALELGPRGAWLIAPVLAASVLAVVYVWRVVEAAWFLPAASEEERQEAPWWMLTTLWVSVLLNVYFGFQPSLPLELAGSAAASLLGGGHAAVP